MSKLDDEVINGPSNIDSDDDKDSDSNSDSSDSDSNDSDDNKVPKKFRKAVRKYIYYDDLIREKSKELKELKEKRKPYEETAKEYMEEKELKSVGVTGGKIHKNKSKTKTPLTLSGIREKLKKNMPGKDDLISTIIADLRDNRAKVTRINLKRTFTKKDIIKTKKKK